MTSVIVRPLLLYVIFYRIPSTIWNIFQGSSDCQLSLVAALQDEINGPSTMFNGHHSAIVNLQQSLLLFC